MHKKLNKQKWTKLILNNMVLNHSFFFFGLDSSEEDYCVLCHLAMIIKSKTTRRNGHLIFNLETQVKL